MLAAVEEENTEEEDISEASCSLIPVWKSKGKASADDEEATTLLLNLRQKYATKFDDKKTTKTSLWNTIASEMRHTYDVNAVQCKQKFDNLYKTYLKHLSHMKMTGTDKKDPPPFFNEMHGIMGDKHKSNNPCKLEDSESSATNSDAESVTIKNRFSNAKKTEKPASSTMVVLEELKRQHEEDVELKKEHVNQLKMQNKHREEFLDLFKTLVKKMKPNDNE